MEFEIWTLIYSWFSLDNTNYKFPLQTEFSILGQNGFYSSQTDLTSIIIITKPLTPKTFHLFRMLWGKRLLFNEQHSHFALQTLNFFIFITYFYVLAESFLLKNLFIQVNIRLSFKLKNNNRLKIVYKHS